MQPEIVLIRGLPGSGKTTMAKAMIGHVHFEADMFLEIDGKYVFDASRVPKAHDWCVASAKTTLEQGKSVVISNTFVKLWELKRYVALGFPYRVIEAKGSWPNIHGVPLEKIAMMRAQWEPLSTTMKAVPAKSIS